MTMHVHEVGTWNPCPIVDCPWNNDEAAVECEKPCHGDHAPGTMISGGLPCWRILGHDGQCVCPMCPDAFEV